MEEFRAAVAKEREERMLTEVKSISSVPQAKNLKSSNSISIGVSKKTPLNALVVKRKSIETNDGGNDEKRRKTSTAGNNHYSNPFQLSSRMSLCRDRSCDSY